MDGPFSYRRGRLFVEGTALGAILREVGTPAYVYAGGRIRERFRRFDAAFAGVDRLVCYALKANPSRAVCRLLAGEGAGADVVSGGELKRALDAGFPPARIVFSGAGKTAEELALAVRRGARAVHVESAAELSALSRIAARLGRRAAVAVRVNPDLSAGHHAHVAVGTARSKFGVPAREALKLALRAARDPRLKLAGLHAHAGSQIESPAPYRRLLKLLLGLSDRLRAAGAPLEYVDVGGGMGIAYPGRRELAPEALAAALKADLGRRPGLKLLLEPGRWLVGPAGLLAATVLYRKRAGGKALLVVDAGMNDLLRPALYGARHEILPERAGRAREAVAVAGPVCENADTFAGSARLPRLAPGAAIAVLQAGAYGMSMSSQYNSRPRPPEVVVEGGRWRLARRREGYEDLVRHER